MPFLEHIIGDVTSTNKNNEKGPEFHNELIFQYLDAIMVLLRDPVYQEQKKG